MAKSKRQANYELLRIIAMLMVIILHYLNQTGAVLMLGESADWKRVTGTLLQAFCIVAVNVYVMISGYFLVDAGFKVKRILVILSQVLFYSVVIPLAMAGMGMLQAGENSGIYRLASYLFPIGTEHYWFATSYVIMYLFTPILNMAVRSMSKRQMQITLTGILILFCGIKSISPIQFVTDRFGYDFGWFLCVYLAAAYIRLHGIAVFSKARNCWLVYIGSAFAIFGVVCLAFYLNVKTGAFTYYFNVPFHYNYILCLIGAAALFGAFGKVRIPEGNISRIICRISPLTFGVYLLHQHMDIRNEWIGWLETFLGSSGETGVAGFFFHLCISVMLVFLAGILIDGIRKIIFDYIGKYLKETRLLKWINKLDQQ